MPTFFLYLLCVNHNEKGCYAEYKFAASAIEKGYNVSFPILDSSVYDCILEKDYKIYKIQIKFLGKDRYKHNNSMQLTLRRQGSPTYDLNDVDFFAIWCEQHEGFYIIKNEGQKTLKLYIHGKYKNNFNNFALIS